MPSNKVSYDQAPYLALRKIAPDRSSSYLRQHWGDNNGQLPSKGWYYGNRINFDLFNGTRLLGGIHKDALCAFQAFNHELMLSDYHAKQGETWGGAYRNVRGSSRPSTHAFLCAVDLTSSLNPMSSRFMTDMPVAMIKRIYAQVSVLSGHPVWVWGGAWTRRKDAMHFNLQVSPHELSQGVRCSDGTVFKPGQPIKATPPKPQTVFSIGSKHSQVKEIQKLLIKQGMDVGVADGSFGPRTQAAVIAWQKKLKLKADGIWGPGTEEATRAFLAGKTVAQAVAIMDQPAAVAIIKAAYIRGYGRAATQTEVRQYITRVRRGKLDGDQIVRFLELQDEGAAWKLKKSENLVRTVRAAVLASYVDKHGVNPSAKDLTEGITKVSSALSNLWK